MPQPLCRGHVVENRSLTHDVKQITIKPIEPSQLHFTAGQYISIEITEVKDGVPRKNNRPYSIASPPEEKEVIQLCVNLVEGGPGSTYLYHLREGEEISFLYPMGYFTIDEATATELLFVATGTGIAPIRSMIHHLFHIGYRRKISLFWGLRSERDLYYQEEFLTLSENHPNFRFIPSLSRPTDRWSGARGRVTQLLPEAIGSVEGLEAYLCGNGEMIKEVRQILLGKGMGRKAVHYEKFY
jgi:ferredoxin-NADP reductase